MTTPDPQREILQRLQRPRRAIRQAQIKTALARGFSHAMPLLVAIGCSLLVMSAMQHAIGFAIRWLWVAAASAGAMFVVFLVTPLATLFRSSLKDEEVAERLDLATGNHNRIASALSFAAQANVSRFAQAAIDEGLLSLRTIHVPPQLIESAAWHARRNSLLGLLGSGLLVFFLISVGETHLVYSASDSPFAATTSTPTLRGGESPTTQSELASENQGSKRGTLAIATANAARAASSANRQTLANQFSSSLGSKAGSISESQTHLRPGAGKPSRASETGTADGATARKSEQLSAATNAGDGSPQKPGAGDAGFGGGSGDSQQSTATSDAASDKRSPDSELDRNAVAETQSQESGQANQQPEPPGGSLANTPMRQDRDRKASHETGSGNANGTGGNGRDTSGAGEKSRGVAVMLMTMPYRDYIKGLLSPGESKVTLQQVPPQPANLAKVTPTPTAAGRSTESVLNRYDVLPGESADVLRYFETLHRAGNEPAPSTSGGAPDISGKENAH